MSESERLIAKLDRMIEHENSAIVLALNKLSETSPEEAANIINYVLDTAQVAKLKEKERHDAAECVFEALNTLNESTFALADLEGKLSRELERFNAVAREGLS
jgi:hypothetical protein